MICRNTVARPTKTPNIVLDNQTLKKIIDEAKREKISPTKLASRIIDNHYKLRGDGFVPIRNNLLTMLIDKYTHEEIDSLASKMASNKTKNTIIHMYGKFDVKSTLKAINDWVDSTNFPYSYEVKDSKHRFVILHGLGTKWSLYLAKLLAKTFNQLGLIPEYDYTNKILFIAVNTKEKDLEKKRTDKQIEILSKAIAKNKTN